MEKKVRGAFQSIGKINCQKERKLGKKAAPIRNEDRSPIIETPPLVSSTVPKIPETCKAEDIDFPSDGIVFSYFVNDFIAELGGRKAIGNKTTSEICIILKDRTKEDSCSFLDSKKPTNSLVVRKANCFISHAWDCNFLSLVETLQNHFPRDQWNETVIWLDILSCNQHNLDGQDLKWIGSTLKAAIQGLSRLVLIVDKWYEPRVLKRAWCVWEMFCICEIPEGKFEIAMPQQEKRRFCLAFLSLAVPYRIAAVSAAIARPITAPTLLCKRPFTPVRGFICRYNAEDCSATRASDKEKIFQAIEVNGGFVNINKMVEQRFFKQVILQIYPGISQGKLDALLNY
jgi:hypothetical protein